MDRRHPRKNRRPARRFKAPRVLLGTSSKQLPAKRNDNNLEINAKGRGDVLGSAGMAEEKVRISVANFF
jgi:hypothetical protein